MNEDGMLGRKLRSVARAKDLMEWFESKEQPWLSHLECLKVGIYKAVAGKVTGVRTISQRF